MCVADEVSIAVSGTIKLNRIVTPCRIRSASAVALSSSDLDFELFGVVLKSVCIKIDNSVEYLDFTEIGQLAKFEGVEVELELEAVSAVKLLPISGIADSELPGPVKVFDTFYFLSHLVRNLTNNKRLL